MAIVNRISRALCVAMLVFLYVFQPLNAEELDDVITGAGAHFAWVVFDAFKPELERVTGRKFMFHGLNSTLGLGCNAGIKLAMKNRDDAESFGFVCCPLSDQEVQEKDITVYPIALEPILILVNQDNPVTNLDSDQVRAIFRGEITNWKDVGGPDRPIVTVNRLHCKKRPGHWKTILPNAKDFSEKRLSVSSAGDMVKRVTAFPEAMGHVGATWEFAPDSRVRAVSIDGYQPTAENLKARRYPFFRQLSAVTNKSPSDDVLAAIHEVQYGPVLREIAQQYQLVPLMQ